MKQFLFAGLMVLALSGPAATQQTPYQPSDDKILQECTNTISSTDDSGNQSATNLDCIGLASEACQQQSAQNQTTIGMVECISREVAWWDSKLNKNYTTLRDILDAEEFNELRKAQRAWLAYRDAECDFQYFFWREGTIRSLFGATCILQTTAERTLNLGEVIAWMRDM